MAETSEHLALKELAAQVARRLGWSAELEARSDDGRWVADVLLARGTRRVAVEIQWSSQPHGRYEQRQARYADYGVEVIWLHRNTRLEPAAYAMEGRVSVSSEGFEVELAGFPGQRLPAEAFVEAALDGSLRYGLSPDDPINLTIMAAEAECWHDACSATYRMIPAIFATIGRYEFVDLRRDAASISLTDIGDHPDLRGRLLDVLATGDGWDHVKERSSRTMERSYLSCGCPCCGRIMGSHFAFPYIVDAEPTGRFQVPISLLPETLPLIEEGDGNWIVW